MISEVVAQAVVRVPGPFWQEARLRLLELQADKEGDCADET